MIIDTHCHLNGPKLAPHVPELLERARSANVTQMIVVGYDLESSEEAVRLSERYRGEIYAVIGIHPHEARHWDRATEERLRQLADHPHVVAVGEIGLDYHYDFSPRDVQANVFRIQMGLARETGLPVVIHCREAYEDTLRILSEEAVDTIGGVMHCWAGTVEDAERTVALGMSLGFGGTLTFKNAEETRAGAKRVDLESLLLETDAPYLAPMPYRGKVNEPAYTRLVAEKMAELRGLSVEEVERLTTANARRVFPKLADPV